MSNRHAIVGTHRLLLVLVTALATLLTSLLVTAGAPAQASTAPAAVAAVAAAPSASVSERDITLTGSLGTRRTFHATLTRSATTLAGYTTPAKGDRALTPAVGSSRFDSFTGIYYYSYAQPIWTYTTDACMSLNGIEWKECLSFRIYYVRNHLTGRGVVVWGANYTFAGLRGVRHCHAPGSGTLLARYQNMACGEHRFDPDKTRMKQWDEFQITYNPGPQEVYAFHVNEYATGALTGPYSGLGA
jgi:hypothetical protein